MEIREIRTTASFDRSYQKLPEKIKNRAEIKEKIFRQNPFHPTLKTHKLHGKEKEVWAFSVDFTYRIKFVFLTEVEVLLLDIGTHGIYE